MEAKLLAAFSLLLVAGQCTATAISRSERSAESTPASTLQTTINSSLCGDVRLLLQQQGKDGRDGRDGLQGKPGPQGPVGPEGSVGPSGMKGEKGDPGIQQQGADGPQGPAGLQGPTGPSGMKGEKGDPGIQQQGADGPQGPAGPQGPIGPSGMKGEKGDQGTQLQGPPGLQGLTGPAGPPGPTAGGVVYTRWGRTTCPTTSGIQLVYAGRAAGSWYNQNGGGAEYLCLPDDPNYLSYTNGVQDSRSYLYGAEYKTHTSAAQSAVLHHNVPCAVCYASTRGTEMMIPGKTVCPSSWTREYYGYLMAAFHRFPRTKYVCLDHSPQSIPGSASSRDGAMFHQVEARCYGICPPYTDGRELTCTVCTK